MKNASGHDCFFGFYEAVNTDGNFMVLADLLVTADGQYWLIMAWPSICARCCRRRSLGIAKFFLFFLFCLKNVFSVFGRDFFFS